MRLLWLPQEALPLRPRARQPPVATRTAATGHATTAPAADDGKVGTDAALRALRNQGFGSDLRLQEYCDILAQRPKATGAVRQHKTVEEYWDLWMSEQELVPASMGW